MKQNIYDNDTFFKSYTSLRKTGVTYNDFVEQPAIKSAISTLNGKTVLDLGCGNGQFSKYCVDNGAVKVTAVDISMNMIEQAKHENKHDKIDYICTPIEDYEVKNQKFDLIVSSLMIHYVEDYTELIEKVESLLNKNGEFIFSTEHPIVTSRKEMNNWMKDEGGNKLHWKLDHYQEEGKREQHWYVDGVVKYHRTISTLINTVIQSGLVLEKLIEPQSIPSGLEKMPKLMNEKRRPSFIVIKAIKQND
ncbi:class I SAM-dependent methyltransferase [Metabacillus malikii]|uniref:2-polyprenyl-3-methyl-5-hydroxy-6-metoxy-1, 4-benzoquinol methylase n=1 Tax=Metabacillus malikii TaxID=1504265 RepID=A0ABT9ZLT6_9BACI|nr:class I SAM-dependent methyltransferase [Metabacillus malikii]MDQ0233251.1 2-polyprenyl-3-methyl-5-hydroxy-6-metoxy-1,4-benzoquinol methylase [Metabacillus malikii]